MTITAEASYSFRTFRRMQFAAYSGRVWSGRVVGAVFVVGGALFVSPALWTWTAVGYGVFLLAYCDVHSLYSWLRHRRSAGTKMRFDISDEGVKITTSATQTALGWSAFSTRKVGHSAWLLRIASSGQKFGIPRSIFAEDDQERIDWLVRGITPVHASSALE